MGNMVNPALAALHLPTICNTLKAFGFLLTFFLEPFRVDRITDVSQEGASIMTRRIAKEEGVLAGMSSGGALTAAIKLASEIEEGVSVISSAIV